MNKATPFNGNFYSSSGDVQNLLDVGDPADEFLFDTIMPFNGNFLNSSGEIQNLLELGEAPKSSPIHKMAPFNGNFYASDGTIHNVEELLASQNGSNIKADNPINFYDYDGRLLYSWSLEKSQNVKALPKGPIHDKLEFKNWSLTLEQLNGLTEPKDVTAVYTTKSGFSEFDITLSIITGLAVTIRANNVGGTLTINWGEGTQDTFSSTGLQTATHVYSDYGDYQISIDSTGSYSLFGNSSSPFNMFNSDPSYICTRIRLGERCTGIANRAFYNCFSLQQISISPSVTNIGDYSFYACRSLNNINLPTTITQIGVYCFRACFNLRSIILPSTIVNIPTQAFYACYALTNIIIPNEVTTISNSAFRGCYCLSEIKIPKKVTMIAASSFYECSSVKTYTLLSATPPTLENSDVFTAINGICKIKVPNSSLNDYKTAINWDAYIDYVVGV